MLTKLKLSARLPVLFAGAATAVAIGIGIASYIQAKDSVSALTHERLVGAAKIGAGQYEQYLKTIESELELVASNPLTAQALKSFTDTWKAWTMFGGDPEAALKAAYIENNPHPVGQKHLLDRADGDVHYNNVHAKFHPWFRNLQQKHDYYDVFLFDAAGNLVYSVFKEADFATNFSEDGGPWASTDLGSAFRQALNISNTEGVTAVYRGFKPYGPSNDAPASFLASPVFDETGNTLGVLAFQMPIERTNEIFDQDFALGQSGELLIAGADQLMRNDSVRTADTTDILSTHLNTPLIAKAIADGVATGTTPMHRGEPMRVAVNAINYHGVDYAIIAAMSEREAMAPATDLRNSMAITGVLLLSVVIVAGWFLARTITRPINDLVARMNTLSTGDTEIDLSAAERGDEIGDMYRTVAVFRDNAIERLRLEHESQQNEETQATRRNKIDQLVSSFKMEVERGLEAVSNDASSMTSTSNTLSDLASATLNEAGAAETSSEAASNSAQAVATGAEELSASIGEISRQVATTTTVVDNATQLARNTNEQVTGLADAASRIGAVVSMIQEIAEQTNLLALNATIEAARAGEAGKGFAVVASEVKQLAEQTAKATDEISTQIGAIQGSTGATVEAIAQIVSTMEEVNSYASAIAAAVEQQGAATNEISASIAQSAASTDGVVSTITKVKTVSEDTSRSAEDVRTAATSVSERTGQLRETVGTFLREVAAA